MNPMLKRLLATAAVPAKENLVQDAADANNTAGTTDPEQTQKNVDFQAELTRLKELQGDASGDGGDAGLDTGDGATPDGVDAGDGSADAGGDLGDAGGDQSTDQAPDNISAATDSAEGKGDDTDKNKDGDDTDPDQDPGNGDADAQADAEGGDDAGDDSDVEELNEDAEVAQEALRVAAEALGALARAHEHGHVKPQHVKLFDTALESQYINLGVQQRPALSTENNLPESSMSKLKYAAGRVKEFLKQVLAKIREYYGKIVQWLKAAFRGWQEARGNFEKNTEGLIKRIAYLKGKERPAEEIEKLAEEKQISLRALATSSEAPTLESVAETIKVLTAAGTGIGYAVTDDAAYGQLVDMVSRFDQNNPEASVTGTENAITPERMFRISGSASVFNNSTLYKNSRKSESSLQGMVDFVIEGLPGLSSYRWTLAPQDATTIDGVIHNNNLYGFAIHTQRQDVSAPLLTSLDDCTAALQLTTALTKELLRFKDAERVMMATQAFFVKNEDTMKQVVEVVGVAEDIKIKVLMVHSTAQAAYTNLFAKSAVNHVKVVQAAIAAIHAWVAASLNIIAPVKGA